MTDLLNELIQHFYAGRHNLQFKHSDIQLMDWEWQDNFLKATVKSEMVLKYPVSSQFVKLFFKKIIQHLETAQEVHDDFYSCLCTAMNDVNNNFSYRHYVLGNDLSSIITIKETKNMVVNGTTGLKTWEAARMLADWALCNKDIFANKRVLELGSGVGFSGITIAKHCHITNLLLSDCHEDVLRMACENIQINLPHCKPETLNKGTFFAFEECNIGVIMLDWNHLDNLSETIVPDIVIGADIVYDPSILSPLCNVLRVLTSRNEKLEVYIASVIRNEDTFKSFLETLSKENFMYEKLEFPSSTIIQWDESVTKCILKINLGHR